MFDILISKLLELLVDWGYKGLFLSSMGVFPTEIVIALLATTHQKSILGISLVSALGGLVGSYLTYFLGYLFTEENVYGWLEGNGKFLNIKRKEVEKSKERILEKSFLYVLITRLVPWLRVIASLAAGVIKVRFIPYSIAVFIGGFIYAFIIAFIGSQVDSDLESIKRYISLIDKWLVILFVTYILASLVYKHRGRIRKYFISVFKQKS